MRVPLVAPEDLRDDIIENAPSTHTEEYSGEEKTWMWYVWFPAVQGQRGGGGVVHSKAYRVVSSSYGDWWAIYI